MIIHNSFPRYTEFDPLVPVWCITHDMPGCMHRFFDSSAISPSGRYIATFQLPFEDRQPEPGECGNIWLIDLENGKKKIIAETKGWEPQLGANINWGNVDSELFYNDVDTLVWKPYAWKINPLTGNKTKMDGTVYHSTLNGKLIVSSNLSLLRKTQNGYGVAMPKNMVKNSYGLRDDEGFYITNTVTGKNEYFISIRQIVKEAFSKEIVSEISNSEIYGFHSKFNTQGDRMMLSLRWYPKRSEYSWNMFEYDYRSVRMAWITSDIDGKNIKCAIGPEHFIKGGHHATWHPDGEHITLNLKYDGKNMRFVQVKYDGTGMKEIIKNVKGSGHPTVHPSGNILTDTYLKAWDFEQYGDGTVPLRWVSIKSGNEHVPIRINVKQPYDDSALRIDPHPAWDRTWRYIVFNGFSNGSRRVYIADMERMYSDKKLPPPIRTANKKKSIIKRLIKKVMR